MSKKSWERKECDVVNLTIQSAGWVHVASIRTKSRKNRSEKDRNR